VPNVAGTWKDLTDNVNLLANNLTAQVRNIAEVTTAVARATSRRKFGRCQRRNPRTEEHHEHDGGSAQVVRLGSYSRRTRSRHRRKTRRPGRSPGRRGYLEGSDRQRQRAGRQPDRPGPRIVKVVPRRQRRLVEKISVDVKGEILELKTTINTLVDQLNSFSAEVTRVAREVGTEENSAARRKLKACQALEGFDRQR